MNSGQKKSALRIALSAALLIAAVLLPFEGNLRLAAFLVPYAVAGCDVLWQSLRHIARGHIFDEIFLMSVASLGALALGKYPEAVAVMLFYQLGELFESIAVVRSRRSISELMDIRPDSAVVLRGGEEISVSPEDVLPGETIIVRPGERIPLDGTVTEGETSVNTSALTGESLPADVCAGGTVLSGTVNLTGLIKVRTSGSYSESTAARILELVESSTERKARIDSFVSRFAVYYTPCVVIGAVLLAAVPPLFFALAPEVWLHRALVFLVVSCPCAVVISVPLSFFGGIGGASGRGVLIKGSNYLETLSKVDAVVFDKTGTLTCGHFKVVAVHPQKVSEEELLDIAAAAESCSVHPVAESIIAAHGRDIDKSRLGSVTEMAGLGIEAVVDGRRFFVGGGKLMDKVGAEWHECRLGGTVIHVSEDSMYLGHIVINDVVKPDARESVSALRELGINRIVMLTGDGGSAAESVAKETGISEYRASLLPGQKVEAVEELIAQGHSVAFVGDGINDAPVLARSDVGIAMGALGSDAAIESADIVIMNDRPSDIPKAVMSARRTMGIVRQNIVFSITVKALILLVGALGYAGIWLAVFGDVGVMVIAVLNSMRAVSAPKQRRKHTE